MRFHQIASAAAMLLVTGLAVAQDSQQGSITGFVYDQSQAVIPGVEVTATSRNTGLSRASTTNEAGLYTIVGLQPGVYDIRASSEGFKTVAQSDAQLSVGAILRVDFTMEIGAVSETINVTGAAPILSTETGEVSHIVSGTQVTELALNGRNFTQFLALGTGVSSRQTGRQMGLGQEGNPLMVIHGGRISMNKYTYDGTLAMDTGGNRGLNVFPPMEAIEEVKVQKSNYGADAGGFGFGIVNIVTRSGGKDFHGSLYEFWRNDKLDSRNFFSNERQVVRSNNFGFTIGGPIYIPGKYNTARNKSFFFWSQAWARRVGQQINTFTTPPQGVFTANVPTVAMRNGDFSGVTQVIRDPATGNPFPNKQIPSTMFDPNAVLLINTFYPLPNRAGTPNFVHNAAAFTTYREELMRFDHHFTDNMTWTVRYAQDTWAQEQDIKRPGTSVLPTFPNRFGKPGKNLTTKLNNILSPAMVNQFTFGYSFNTITNAPRGGEKPSGLNIPEAFASNTWNQIPNITMANGFAALGIGDVLINDNPIFTFKDDFSWTRGTHTLKFGGEIIWHAKGEISYPNEQGTFNFNAGATGYSVSDFLLGRAFNYTENDADPGVGVHAWDNEFYFQDDWKVSRNFTLNLGVRWYLIKGGNGGPADDDNISNFVPSLYSLAQAPTMLASGQIVANTGDPLNGIITPADKKGIDISDALRGNSSDTIGPRFGFAWTPGGGKTVFRGGYGINYFWGADTSVPRKSNPPFVSSVNVQNVLLSSPVGVGLLFPPNLNAIDINQLQPTVQSWSFSTQRQLADNTSIEVAYVGTRGTHLQRGFQLNQADPFLGGNVNLRRPYRGYGTIAYNENSAESTYHGLEVTLSRRMANGLMIEGAYTFSKALGHAEGNPVDGRNKTLDWGLLPDDRTHIFTLNYVWQIPGFENGNGALKAIFGGWQLSGITTFQSGLPFTVTQPGDSANLGAGTGAQRPDRVGDPHEGRGDSLDRWFNVAAFQAVTGAGRIGTEPINGVRGPGIINFDAALLKNINLSEQVKFQFGLETFNFANHANFDSVGAGLGSPDFGRVTSSLDPRVLQLRAKFLF
jgi:hypothetical protein